MMEIMIESHFFVHGYSFLLRWMMVSVDSQRYISARDIG